MLEPKFGSILIGVSGEEDFWKNLLSWPFWSTESHVTRSSFAIPITSQEQNVAAKFQLDRPGGLAREVEIGDRRTNGWTDGQTVHDGNTSHGIAIPDKLIIKLIRQTWMALSGAHTSARLNNLHIVSYWQAGSASIPSPKSNQLVLVTCPNHPPSFIIIRPKHLEISCYSISFLDLSLNSEELP